jgi:hypothetical protein
MLWNIDHAGLRHEVCCSETRIFEHVASISIGADELGAPSQCFQLRFLSSHSASSLARQPCEPFITIQMKRGIFDKAKGLWRNQKQLLAKLHTLTVAIQRLGF